MNVLVTGGTGFIGSYLCTELDDQGHDVTAMARSPDPDAVPAGVDTVAGDVTDPDSLEGPMEGQDAVVHLVALSPLYQPSEGEEAHYQVHLRGTENVVKAAKDHGVSRFVHLSAVGADPHGATAYVRAKGRAEGVVRESDLDWVIVRPSIVFGNGGEFIDFTETLTTPYVTGLPGGGEDMEFQPIQVEDLVPMLAAVVEDDTHVGQTYEIAGPERLSLADVTRLIYRSKGKSVTILPVPMGLAGLGLNTVDPIPGVPFGEDQYRSLTLSLTTDENDIDAFGLDERELTTLAEYLGAR